MNLQILCIVFFIPLLSFSQSFDAGIRLGVVASQVNGDNLSGFDKAGVLAGGFVSRELNEEFAAQLEIVFIQKGSRKPLNDLDNTYYRMRVHYIEVPILFKWKFTRSFSLVAGPSVGTLIFSEEDNETGVLTSLPFEKYEIAANAGLQYRISERVFFDGRFSRSWNTIRPFPGVATSYFDKGQVNVVMEFSLLYGF